MIPQKLWYVVMLVGFLFLVGCGDKEVVVSPPTENNSPIDKSLESNTGELIPKQSLTIDPSYQEQIEQLEAEQSGTVSYEKQIVLVQNYLNAGNSLYQEKENAQKAIEILKILPKDKFLTLFHLGYANEINADYEKALDNYEKAKSISGATQEDIATVLNQIGHVYDLQGEMKKAGEYYLQSEKMGFSLIGNLINRGRYEFRMKNYEGAKVYFEKVLSLSTDSFTRAEMDFNLSNISLLLGDSSQAQTFAELGIKENELYPYNHFNLGIIAMSKGGDQLDVAKAHFEKTLNLYQFASNANKQLGIYYYIKDDFEQAIFQFKSQMVHSQVDITLMKDEKDTMKRAAVYDLARCYARQGKVKESVSYLDKLFNDKKNTIYYVGFLNDYSSKTGPFTKVINDEVFQQKVKQYIEFYK